MTVNGWIAGVNAGIALLFVALGLALLWQARRSLRVWPVSALVALAGPYLLAGLVFAQLSAWRSIDMPGHALDRDGPGTLALRIATAAVAFALVRRIVAGALLTRHDRARMDGSG